MIFIFVIWQCVASLLAICGAAALSLKSVERAVAGGGSHYAVSWAFAQFPIDAFIILGVIWRWFT